MSATPRPRTGRATYEQLGRRDLDILGWVCEQYAARLDQVSSLVGEGPVAAQALVERLCNVGFARTQRYLVDEPPWLLPTQRGLRVCGLVCRPRSLTVGRIAHIAAINDVRIHIQRRAPQTLWISERQLLMEHPKSEHPPDGLAILDQRQIAIEVELTGKRPHRIRDIVLDLERRYDEVLYYCAPAPLRQLTRLAGGGGHPGLGVRPLPGGD